MLRDWSLLEIVSYHPMGGAYKLAKIISTRILKLKLRIQIFVPVVAINPHRWGPERQLEHNLLHSLPDVHLKELRVRLGPLLFDVR